MRHHEVLVDHQVALIVQIVSQFKLVSIACRLSRKTFPIIEIALGAKPTGLASIAKRIHVLEQSLTAHCTNLALHRLA